MADWNSIPSELVAVIANKLSAIEDYTALTAVCRSFKSSTKAEEWRREEVSQPPWLLLSADENPPTRKRGLLSMYRNRKKFLMNLPELRGRSCWGSPYGWIVTLGLYRNLHLFNPLNRRRIALPDPFSLQTPHGGDDVWKRFIDRAILIKRPPHSYSSSTSDDFLVVAVTDGLGSLAVMRPRSWEYVVFLCEMELILDVICYKGQIYALGNCGMLTICFNFDGPDLPTADEFVPYDPQFRSGELCYVVESLGELVLVVRRINYDNLYNIDDENSQDEAYSTYDFEVFKLDFEAKKWVKLDDLRGCALFVGNCQSISLSRPEDFNCRRDCIYFTDDSYLYLHISCNGGKDMGIFDLKKKHVHRFYDGAPICKYSAPTWFIPTR